MSNFLNINWKDLMKGLLVAVIGAILTAAYEAINAGTIQFTWAFWQPIVYTGIAAGMAYLIKNLFTNSTGNVLTSEKK
jgi:hypothetical protein